MLKMLFNDIEKKLKESTDGKIHFNESYKQEYSSREFKFIDIDGAHYIEKGDDSENQDQCIAWYAMPQTLFMKIYNYVMEIK